MRNVSLVTSVGTIVSRTDTAPRYPLPGGKIDVASRARWVHSMAGGSWLFGPRHKQLLRAARSRDRSRLHRAERRWAKSAERLLKLDIDVHGIEHVDPRRSYVVTPLHEGLTDLIAIQHLPLDMVYASAKELLLWDHLGPYLQASGQPLVSQESRPSSYRSILRAGNEAAAHHESLVVFPQGTILGIETAFRPGAFRVAERLGLPVLPVVLTGSALVWDFPFSTRLNHAQSIHMEVLPPIDGGDAVAAARVIEDEMKDRALTATPPPRRFDPDADGWWDGYHYEIDERFAELHERHREHRAHQRTARSQQALIR